MKPSPDERACDWVRDRLPSVVRDVEDPAAGEDERPGPDERRAAAAHLEACEACRSRRDGLARAFAALQEAAGESPVESRAPSLWPALQARIEAREAREGRSRRPAAGGSARSRSRSPLERASRRLAEMRDDLPLQAAWLRDSIREEAPGRLHAWFDVDRVAVACDRVLRPLASPVGAAAAAALMGLLVGLPLAERLREDAESRILAAEAPLPAASRVPLMVTPLLAEAMDHPQGSGAEFEPADLAAIDDQSLARNTAPPLGLPDELGLAAAEPSALPPSPPQAQGVATPHGVRYDFDLDRGVPMPPEIRADKPAY